MNPTVSLGRIAGIRIGLNWSWAIVLALIVWSLADAVFPAQDPGLSRAAYAGMAVAAALLFFVSLLLHEFGHALQARREGLEIEGITLWLFGGVAQFKGEFPSARAELRIALAGPAVTLAIGSVLIALAALAHLPSGVDGVVFWLGYINFFLLAFNLLPALPLDGGRVLRALIWARRRDFGSATRTAAEVSRALALVLIGGGLLLLFTEGTFSGAWLAFIGWFVLQAAGSEARYPLIREALAGLAVRNLMAPDPLTAEAGQTLAEFMEQVPATAHFTAYPVLDGERVVGMLPFRRVVDIPPGEWSARLVADSLVPLAEVPLLHPDESALDAFAELSAPGLHRGLVLRDGRLVGLLSITDFARVLGLAGRP